jgi:hypothetical protein
MELQAFAPLGAIERRSDAYLRGTDELRGIKQRNGTQLEDKRRTAIFALSLDVDEHRLHGTVERWHKRWPRRAELDLDPDLDLDLDDAGNWLRVDKRRAVLVRDAAPGQPGSTSGGPGESCRVELTGLRIGELHVQTLAFETLETEDPVSTLAQSAQDILHDHPELLLRIVGKPSLSYPAWLASLVKFNTNPT